MPIIRHENEYAATTAPKRGHRCVVCSNPTARRLMDFAGIARLITIFDRVSDAHRALIEQTADALASLDAP